MAANDLLVFLCFLSLLLLSALLKLTASSPARAENRRTQPRAVVYGTPAAAAAGRTPHAPPATRPITAPADSAASSRQASANAGSSA